MALLLSGPRIRSFRKSKHEWLVISKNYKTSAIYKITEMTNGKMNSKQFTIESTVFDFWFVKHTAKERQWLPSTISELLKYSANSDVQGIHSNSPCQYNNVALARACFSCVNEVCRESLHCKILLLFAMA